MFNETNFKNILLKQYQVYPKMQIEDMVKLIYQNEFAGGHLITDETDSLTRLQEEYRTITKPKKTPDNGAFEDIGNGLCRLHLNALPCGMNLSTINRFFISTSLTVCGCMNCFKRKLALFSTCCNNRELPYDTSELKSFIYNYQKAGFLPISHSAVYRDTYSPAYRIVRKEYRDFIEVFQKIDLLLESKSMVTIAIDGNSCAGKTTLASLIGSVYDCNIFHMDHYFLRSELRTKDRMEEIGGNIDYMRFSQEIITGLLSGRRFQYKKYDCKRDMMGPPISILPKKLNIIEGSYSMHPMLSGCYDFKVFLEVDKNEQHRRILKRNSDLQNKFFNEWIPMENRYISGMNIKEKSDIIITYTG